MAQPPSPHAITGSLSFPGNVLRSSGRNTTWPGEPGAGSDFTLYGPGIAFGAPSSGSVVLTRSAAGAWANDNDAVRMNATARTDFMRRSLRCSRFPDQRQASASWGTGLHGARVGRLGEDGDVRVISVNVGLPREVVAGDRLV